MGDVDAFVAQIRHELRVPINAILGYSQLLLEEAGPLSLTVAERSHLAIVADSGKQLLRIFSEILDPAGFTDGIEEYAYRLRYTTRPQISKVRGCVQTLLKEREDGPMGADLRRIRAGAVQLSEIVDRVEHTFHVRVTTTNDTPQLTAENNDAIEV